MDTSHMQSPDAVKVALLNKQYRACSVVLQPLSPRITARQINHELSNWAAERLTGLRFVPFPSEQCPSITCQGTLPILEEHFAALYGVHYNTSDCTLWQESKWIRHMREKWALKDKLGEILQAGESAVAIVCAFLTDRQQRSLSNACITVISRQ